MTRPSTRPSTAPARSTRVGAIPTPRVRPLTEVLERAVAAPPAAPAVVAPPDAAQDHLDGTAHAVRPVAARLLTAVTEILDGRRPPSQLAIHADPAVLGVLAAHRRPRTGPEGRLRGLRVCVVSPRAVEVGAVVVRGDRARALAARLERPAPDGPWRLSTLALG